MDTIELQPVESITVNDAPEAAQTRELDDATFEPAARIEQTGDYKQSEAIQAGFTAVVDNTATAAAGREDAAPSGEAQEATPTEIRNGGEQDTVSERQPKAAEEFQTAPVALDERDTVLGGQPRIVDAPVGEELDRGGSKKKSKSDTGPLHGPGESYEGIPADAGRIYSAAADPVSRMDLPGTPDEGLPGKGQITEKKSEASGAGIDPITGQVKGMIDGSGSNQETEKPPQATATMQGSGVGREIGINPGIISDVPPPHARPKDQDKEAHRPIGPGITDEPQTMRKGGGISDGSQSPVGPGELFNDHFADQALDAMGYGLIGVNPGPKGKHTDTGLVDTASEPRNGARTWTRESIMVKVSRRPAAARRCIIMGRPLTGMG